MMFSFADFIGNVFGLSPGFWARSQVSQYQGEAMPRRLEATAFVFGGLLARSFCRQEIAETFGVGLGTIGEAGVRYNQIPDDRKRVVLNLAGILAPAALEEFGADDAH